ncbi:MAG: hypothetical protein NUV47_02820 [Patescibacteria group bacterium]|nr:hypothetical protein [Patescibacteria group bacterium]
MSEESGRIEELKKGLYSRKGADILHREGHLREHQEDVVGSWKDNEEKHENPDVYFREESSSFFRNILWSAVIFFVLSLGFAFYILYTNKNVVSADSVNISVAGPISVAGGEPVSLDIKVENNNNVKLSLVDLSIEFPSGTANVVDVTQELKRFRELMGDIAPNSSAEKKVEAVFFGEENSQKQIKITAEYRVEGSNAVFSKEKDYDIFISSSPVSMTVNSLKEVNVGQETSFDLTIVSNSAQTIKNLLVTADYPFGFNFKKSDPVISYGNNVWKIGDLPPGTKKVIKINGTIEGQDEEERVFRFNLGIKNPKDDKTIGTSFMTALASILVKKPFITTTLSLDGDSSIKDHPSSLNRPIRVDVSWVNNTSSDIIDSIIKIKLAGTALDKTTIATDGGFYRSLDNTITWDKTSTPDLTLSHSGDGSHVSFSLIPHIDNVNVKNPEISIDISVQGRRVSESGVPESISSTLNRKIKIISELGFSSSVVPVITPPKADIEGIYNVVWVITNTSNNIADAKVKAILPSYVKWLGKINPSNENVSYNPVGGEILWSPGDISSGTGYSLSSREVSFQIAFTPSVNQVGQIPVIFGESVLTGFDRFSGATIQNSKGSLNSIEAVIK